MDGEHREGVPEEGTCGVEAVLLFSFQNVRWGHFTSAASGGRLVLLNSGSLSLVLASSSLSIITVQTSPCHLSGRTCTFLS